VGSSEFLNPSDAASRLGVSIKALRLYEQRGLVRPARTAAGWRAYGPAQMARVGEVVALRALGLSLAQIARALDGDADGLEPALEAEQRRIAAAVEEVRRLRNRLTSGHPPTIGELAGLRRRHDLVAAFDLPWPWGGERFELREVRPLTHIVGPLFSGKTKLAQHLAEKLPNAVFIGLDRSAAPLDDDPALASRVGHALAWLVDDGAARSDALVALLAALETEGPDILVVDMIEQGLDADTQSALIAHLRRRAPHARPLFFLTRSNAILDLAAVGPNEAIVFCPANHSPPIFVTPHPGAPGYEAVASCLAAPHVRARTEGVIAWRPAAAAG